MDDVSNFLAQLYENKKIAIATHNMYAYRIVQPSSQSTSNVLMEDREDDGEGLVIHVD